MPRLRDHAEHRKPQERGLAREGEGIWRLALALELLLLEPREVLLDVAPGPLEGVIEHREHPVQETEGQPPDDVPIGFAHDDTRKADVGQLRYHVLDLAMAVVQTGQGKPECVLHLVRIEIEGLMPIEMKGVSRDGEP